MFAVIKTGGKQYRVAENDVIQVERLSGDAGSRISLDEVLMIGEGAEVEIGAPVVDGASVTAEVLDQTRGDKVLVIKMKRRKGYRRTQGHRQDLTVLRILEIAKAGAARKISLEEPEKPAAPEPAPAPAPTADETAAEAPVAKKATAKKKTVAKKAAPKKTTAKKKTAAKKTATKKAAPKKKAAAKKSTAKKAGAKASPKSSDEEDS